MSDNMNLQFVSNNINLTRLREVADVTQKAIADLAGRSQPTISVTERDTTIPYTRAALYYYVFFNALGVRDPLPHLVGQPASLDAYDPREAFGIAPEQIQAAALELASSTDGVSAPAERIVSYIDDTEDHDLEAAAIVAAVTCGYRMAAGLHLSDFDAVCARLVHFSDMWSMYAVLQRLITNTDVAQAMEKENISVDVRLSMSSDGVFDPLDVVEDYVIAQKKNILAALEPDETEAWLKDNCLRCYRASPGLSGFAWKHEELPLVGSLCQDCHHIITG